VNLHQDVDFLRGLPLFQFFTEDQLQLLAFNCNHRGYEDGQLLFKKGEQAVSAYIVVSGSVEFFADSGKLLYDGGRFGPGTVIGESAMIVRAERPAAARAVGDVEVMEIPRSVFLRVLREYPEIAEKIRRVMASRVGAFVTDLKAYQKDFTDETA
jgi:CRP-like cAMP-binding protein